MPDDYTLRPIGVLRSTLRSLDDAPRQGSEGGPDARLEIDGPRLRIGPIEAIDGTPVVDVKIALDHEGT